MLSPAHQSPPHRPKPLREWTDWTDVWKGRQFFDTLSVSIAVVTKAPLHETQLALGRAYALLERQTLRYG
jgi:hypothetical protein